MVKNPPDLSFRLAAMLVIWESSQRVLKDKGLTTTLQFGASFHYFFCHSFLHFNLNSLSAGAGCSSWIMEEN